MVAQELRAYRSYERRRLPLQYWRSVHKQEVDFVIGSELALEVKASGLVPVLELKGLMALREENLIK